MNIFTVIACFLQKNHIVQNEWEKLLVDVFKNSYREKFISFKAEHQ